MKEPAKNNLAVIEELNELRSLVNAVRSDTSLQSTGNNQMVLLSRALESLSEMILITDLSHNIIYVNAAVKDILGYNPEEMIGHKAAEFFEGIPSNPSSLVNQATEKSIDGIWKGDICKYC